VSALFCVLKGVKINDKIFHAEYPVLFGRGNDDDCSWVQAQRKGVCNVQPYSSSAPEPTSVISYPAAFSLLPFTALPGSRASIVKLCVPRHHRLKSAAAGMDTQMAYWPLCGYYAILGLLKM